MRKPVGYESSVNVITKDIEKYNPFYLDTNTSHVINNADISLHSVSSTEDLHKLQKNTYSILLEGEIFEPIKYYKEGSILPITNNMVPVSSKCLILTIDKLDSKEDSKIVYDREHLQLLK